jgi:plastocyanin
MTRIRFVLALAALALFAAAPAQAATRLTATVGPGFTITLKKGGVKVRTLRPGLYTIVVSDRSPDHNFRLRGTKAVTGVASVGTRTFTVRLRAGRYTYVCDPHADSMRGTFTVR